MLNMIRLLVLSVSFIAACAHVSVAASFDCNNALNETEIVICDNPHLSALDNLIGVRWKTDRQPIGDTENPTVDSQREWIKRRNTCASDQICILAYYKSRIEEFGFGTVGIFDHAKGKPEFFCTLNFSMHTSHQDFYIVLQTLKERQVKPNWKIQQS